MKPWMLLPAATGGLLWLCFYPIGWGFLGWVALVPLLFLVGLDARPWKIYLSAFLGGCIFYWPILSWMTVADYRMVYTWAMLATYCALYFPVALFMMRRLTAATHWPLALTVPVVWTALEFFRSFFGTGFAWYYLGHTQHHYVAVIQAADLGGVYVISFVMAAVSGWLADFLITLPALVKIVPQPAIRSIVPRRLGLMVLALVAGLLVYGGWRLGQDQFSPGPRVALLQGNLDQRLLLGSENSREITDYYWDLCQKAVRVFLPPPDLLIWPETSFPYPWLELPQDLNKIPAETRDIALEVQNLVRRMARTSKVSQLIGLNCRVFDGENKPASFNSALLLTGEGTVAGRYDKIHRVPFGEYVPLRDWLPFMNAFSPYDFDYSIRPGKKLNRFPLDKYHFGVLICYEDTDPFLARQYGRESTDGPAVDFLVNISNDGWFDGSSQHAEHLAISRFRAVETRRALARAVNMGISAIIDSNGRVQAPLERAEIGKVKMWTVEPSQESVPDLPEEKWRDFTKVEGILTATIPIDNRVSLYAWAGDWLPEGCWLLMVGIWLWRKWVVARFRRGAKP